MLEDGVDRDLVPVDDVEHAVGQARLGPEPGEQEGRGRVLLRRLEDEGVPGRDRHREHPHRDHGGEVERGDPGHHAERLPDAVRIDAGRDVLGEAALEQVRDAAGELDDLEASCDLAGRVAGDLAVLVGDELRQLGGVVLDQLAEREQDGGALGRARRGPRSWLPLWRG